jgi:hypothetical protein
VVAAQLRSLCAAEGRLWELCGGWSAEGDRAAARSFFASQSAFHAWRAEEWRRRLPASVLLEEASATGLLPAGFSEVIDTGRELDSDVARLATWLELLVPSLVVAMRRCRDGLGEVADAGSIRMLRISSDDLLEQWATGSSLMADWAGAESAEAVGAAVERLRPILWRQDM